MRKMTEDNLKAAFAGESQAHMKYQLFADIAEQNGYPNVARLFRAISYAEKVHAANHAKELGFLGDPKENLQEAIDGETYEVTEMYPAFMDVAEMQGEKGAVRSTHYALEAEKIHAAMYETAKQAVSAGSDVKLKTVYVCPICGYTHEGEPPEKCPVCGAPREKFKKFE